MYGRARRIELLKKIGIVFAVTFGVILIARLVIGFLATRSNNVEYYRLKKYLTAKGFACEDLKKSGSACKFNANNITERFVRYDGGFDYLYNNKSYIIEIYHLDGTDKVLFNTGDKAFTGYKNKKYICSYKKDVLGELDKCVLVDDKDVELDNTAYIGIIEQKIYDVNLIINASGYKKKNLIEKYEWIKK